VLKGPLSALVGSDVGYKHLKNTIVLLMLLSSRVGKDKSDLPMLLLLPLNNYVTTSEGSGVM
jgi:hypothetical protein